jgi:hypothetical protein
MMMAMPITGTVLPLDPLYPGSYLNNTQSHNPEPTSKRVELKISAFVVAEIVILQNSATCVTSVVPVTDMDTLKSVHSIINGYTAKLEFKNYIYCKEPLDYYVVNLIVDPSQNQEATSQDHDKYFSAVPYNILLKSSKIFYAMRCLILMFQHSRW